MNKTFLTILYFFVLLLMITCISSCKKNDKDYVQSNISGEEATITQEPETIAIKARIKEIDPPVEPMEIDSSVLTVWDLDEIFALSYDVIYGEVCEVQEYTHQFEFSNGYISDKPTHRIAVTVDVEKNYAGNKLKFIDDTSMIRIDYINSAYEHLKCLHDFVPGEKCFIFISDNAKLNDEYIKDFPDDYFDYVPYTVIMPDSSVIEEVNGKYNANGLMSLYNGTEYQSAAEGRTQKLYSFKKVEKVIEANIDKLKNLSYGEFLDERFLKYGTVL